MPATVERVFEVILKSKEGVTADEVASALGIERKVATFLILDLVTAKRVERAGFREIVRPTATSKGLAAAFFRAS
ncbi:MAG TPA: hypothetical protein VGG32_11325 [Thermoplasmata archaeon]|jgi:predicted Zn-ribbon and HTH transcriptional regulator